jgi:hypothetical protein
MIASHGSFLSDIRWSVITGSVSLSIAGELASSGHSLKDVEAILDAHYLGRDIQLAEAAVLKLEKRTKL